MYVISTKEEILFTIRKKKKNLIETLRMSVFVLISHVHMLTIHFSIKALLGTIYFALILIFNIDVNIIFVCYFSFMSPYVSLNISVIWQNIDAQVNEIFYSHMRICENCSF